MHCGRYRFVVHMVLGCLILTACGSRMDIDTDEGIGADNTFLPSEDADGTKIMTVHTTEGITYSDEEIPILCSEDLSLLDQMGQTDGSYACRDGKIYYRQYHGDSFEEGAVWAYYKPIAGTEKEIVCIDADGRKKVLFSDKGYGDLYLVGERFYMTEMMTRKRDDKDDIEETHSYVYSVDMHGQNRQDYGAGEICVVDPDRNILVVNVFSEVTGEGAYCVLDCADGEMTPITYGPDGALTFWDYCDGWCFFDAHWEDELCQIVAMSVDGGQKTVITLTSDDTTGGCYSEEICRMSADHGRLYIIYGGYAGSGSYFQGGRMITMKLDGSDYQAVECHSDCYYVAYEEDSPIICFLDYRYDSGEVGKTSVWDVEADTISISDFPPELVYAQRERSVLSHGHSNSRILCEVYPYIYALPDDSAKLVRVAERVDGDVEQRADIEWNWDNNRGDVYYQHLYYADGYLYFDAEFNRYDEEYAVQWRDGYRRVLTNRYRLKLDNGTVELLHSY